MADGSAGIPKRGRGRPSAWKPEFVELVYKLGLLGLTEPEMASVLEIDERTFQRWKVEHQDFCQATIESKEIADAEVAVSLRKRALGYSHEAVKIFMPPGKGAKPIYAPYTEHYPPDTNAASLWLRNRQPKLWRDKVDVGVSGVISLEALIGQSFGQVIDAQAKLVEDKSE